MKKTMIYIVILTLVAILTTGGTYAFFTSVTGNDSALSNVETHHLKVIYSGDTEIEGTIEPVGTKEDGFRREISIALAEGSIDAVANIYIYLEEITSGFANVGFKWEIYELNGEVETYVNSGNFYGYESEEKVYMIQNLDLTTTTKEYAVYLWLNGYETGSEVIGAILRGYIGAETEPITGIMG